jgi:5-methylcytosine-specific restriction endonuclease McrA
LSAKNRLKAYFLEHVGRVVDGKDLAQVAGISAWARRVRELREDGWQIVTHHDDASLRPGQYRLTSPDQVPYSISRTISARLRAQVLERNGYTCQMCGAGAGDPDESSPGRTVRLHVGHIIDRSHGGDDTLANLRALCSTCNEGARNLTPEPPSWTWLLSQVRRARVDDQRAILAWLRRKFERDA